MIKYCSSCRENINLKDVNVDNVAVLHSGELTKISTFDENGHAVEFAVDYKIWRGIKKNILREHDMHILYDSGAKTHTTGDFEFVMSSLVNAYNSDSKIKSIHLYPIGVAEDAALSVRDTAGPAGS